MKKHLPTIAGIVLGLMFVMAGMMMLLNLVPEQKFPEGSPIAHYMAAMGPTGYMKFVKVFEVLGGLLVMIPKTRNFGLLILGPIIVNIVAFTIFIAGGRGIAMLAIIVIPALYLGFVERKAFLGLLH